MPYYYQSGEEIRKGDQILYDGEPGEIEFVADPLTGDSEVDWFVSEYGGGVMVMVPKVFGNVLLHNTEEDEDLVFVSRTTDTP